MNHEQGDMWSVFDETDFFLVTTNSYIRQDGALVMGRGIAKQLANRFPHMPYNFANQTTHLGTYGLIIHLRDDTHLGAFQVKHHYSDAATLSLIQYSTNHLYNLANRLPSKRFDMNFPGIGNGRLPYDEVLPIIETLPNNVHIWTYPRR